MDSIEQELICCVCLDLYDTPVILPCSHNLCKSCARGLSDSSGVTRRIFDCPKCRHEVRISPAKGLDGLPENIALKSIVAAVRKQKKDHQVAQVAEVKNCLKHGLEQGHYCKSCRVVLCEACLKEAHLGYGHQVAAATDVLEDEQEKANVCATELKRVLSLLEEQHKIIMKKKDRIAHFERNLQKSLDYEFQQLILSANMTKMALTCAVQRMYKESRESVVAEERRCQELLTEASQLIKVLEDSDRTREMERKIQKLEAFVTKQSGLMTFKFGGYKFDVKDENFPIIKLTGVDVVKKAVEMVKWTREEIPEERAQAATEPQQEVKVFPGTKSSKLASSSSVAGSVGSASGSCDTRQRSGDGSCDTRQRSGEAVCKASAEARGKCKSKGASSASPGQDPSQKVQLETPCSHSDSAVTVHQGAASSSFSNGIPESHVSQVNHQGSGSAQTCTSIFNFCWRSKKSGVVAEQGQEPSEDSPGEPLVKDLQNMSIVKEKQCTKAKNCELDKLLAASKTLTYYTNACKKSLAASHHGNTNRACSNRHGGNASATQNGTIVTTEEVIVCPVTNSNRPLFTLACNRDNMADLQALSKSSCNHGNHSEQPFFKFSTPQEDAQPKLTLPKPQSTSKQSEAPLNSTPASSNHDNGYGNPLFDLTCPRREPSTDPSVFKPVAEEEGEAVKSLFTFSCTNGHDVTPKPCAMKNTINHVENSPFQATDFYKSLSDPGCSGGGGAVARHSANRESPARGRDNDTCGSGPDSPPFLVHTGKPTLQKSKSAGAARACRGDESSSESLSTSPKPLFTIGISMSPKAVKRAGRGIRPHVAKKP